MNSQEINDAIEQAKLNDQRAFGILFDTHWDYVYLYLLKQLQDELLAEEMALKTLAKAFDKISTYKPAYSFNTWLITISKNTQIDYHRSKKAASQLELTSIEKNQFSELSDENPSPEDLLIINQNLKQLLDKIKQLQPQYSHILRLRYFEELSYKEIAAVTKAPLNTIKVTLLRAKKLLAEKIKEE